MASVGSSVGMRVESNGPRPAEGCRLRIRMLGRLEIRRDGAVLPLPASRKVRALLAYLALAPREVSRSQICELLWDVPNDPRGELRWCLSKIRRLVDDAERQRVLAREDAVRLDLADCFVDAIEVQRAMKEGAGQLDAAEAEALATLFGGDLLEGLEMDRSPAFAGWLAAQRRRFRSVHVALLERLATQAPDEEAFGHLETWLELAPFDRRAHELLLGALARCGRLREGEEHLRDRRPPVRGGGARLRRHPPRLAIGPEAGSGADLGLHRWPCAGSPRPRRRPGPRGRPRPPGVRRGDALPGRDRRRRPPRVGRRARPRRDHPPRQAAQPVRHRRGHGVRAEGAAAPGRRRPAAC